MSVDIAVHDVHLRLGQFELRGLSLDLEAGSYVCLLGPTGCGKTALLETIAGLQRPHRGSIRLGNQDVTDLPPEARGIGYVPQDHALFPHMTVARNIAYGLVERHAPASQVQATVSDVARRLKVEHLLERRPTTLSGGERQRVALARALVLGCKILLLDEPLSAVDQSTRRDLVADLRALHREYELTVLHVTHDFTEACGLADRVVVLRDGAVLQTGTPADIFHRPATLDVAQFVGLAMVYPLSQLEEEAPDLAALMCTVAPDGSGGEVCAYLRPDAFRLLRNGDGGPLSLAGTVVDVAWGLAGHDLVVDVGVPLRVTLPSGDQELMQLSPGHTVHLALVPGAAHLVPGSGNGRG